MAYKWLLSSTLTAALGLVGAACGDDDALDDGPGDDSSGADGGSDAGDGAEDAGMRPDGGAAGFELSVTAPYPANGCVASKQVAAGQYCHDVLAAWAAWESSQDDDARDDAIAEAQEALDETWSAAESAASDDGADCSDRALSATEAAAQVDNAVTDVVAAVNDVLDSERDQPCGTAALRAAGVACGQVLLAEANHLADPGSDRDRATLEGDREAAWDALSSAWEQATADDCAVSDVEDQAREGVEDAVDAIVATTIVTPGLDEMEIETISPTGTTSYLGKELTPVCMDGSPYHFFVRRGTVNKVLMYYQGGGACWEELTCSIPVCDANVDPEGSDNPDNYDEGFADRSNPDNPFRDWHQVFVSYCSCDIHFGDAAQDYPTHVEHRGFHNARYAEKWAREHFLDPEVVFVTGSSAGSYGALFNATLLHDAWPAAQFHVLGDAGNGVITPEFLNGELSNWNFMANLPAEVPGVVEALQGEGMVAYLEAVAAYLPDTNWANYSTAYDGGQGGQTGFYNIMLNDNEPTAAVTWWEGSCAFASQMRMQALDTYSRASDNYRYYIGTGSRHTMWGSNKVYDDTTGGVPTIVHWIDAMLRSTPAERDPEWTNVECENCGLTLPGDPVPEPLTAPFEEQGDDIVVVCP